MDLRITIEQILEARTSIAGHVVRTPTVPSAALAARLGRKVVLKLEILQKSGCFKPRGIVHTIASLSDGERANGLVTVSGGNHGIAMAGIAKEMALAATIVMPKKAPRRSQERIRADGATLILADDAAAAFAIAENERAKGMTYIHSYDDPRILAGHGTVGLELLEDAPEVTDVLVSIGGGALISGIATAIKARNPGVRIWGVETEGADAMTRALAAGKPVPIQPTSIATTLGAPFVTERTLAHVKALVEDVFVVPDAQAVEGLLTLAHDAKVWVEPAAGCLVPAARQVIARAGEGAVLGLVLCGGNASFEDVRDWTQRFGVSDGVLNA